MCFPGGATYITRDTCFAGREGASQIRTCRSWLKQFLFLFLFYNFFNRLRFFASFVQFTGGKNLKVAGDSAGGWRILTTLIRRWTMYQCNVRHLLCFEVYKIDILVNWKLPWYKLPIHLSLGSQFVNWDGFVLFRKSHVTTDMVAQCMMTLLLYEWGGWPFHITKCNFDLLQLAPTRPFLI